MAYWLCTYKMKHELKIKTIFIEDYKICTKTVEQRLRTITMPKHLMSIIYAHHTYVR